MDIMDSMSALQNILLNLFCQTGWISRVQNVGDENADSDADPLSGKADAEVNPAVLYLDAGLIPSEQVIPTPK